MLCFCLPFLLQAPEGLLQALPSIGFSPHLPLSVVEMEKHGADLGLEALGPVFPKEIEQEQGQRAR